MSGASYTLYHDLDQLVGDLLYLDAIEEGIPDNEKMLIQILIPPKPPDKEQMYIWQTIPF